MLEFAQLADDARWQARQRIQELQRHASVEGSRLQRAKKTTLEQALNTRLAHLQVEGRTQAYLDQLSKVCARVFDRKMTATQLCSLSADALARAFKAAQLGAGNLRTLRPFVQTALLQAGFVRIAKHHPRLAERVPTPPTWRATSTSHENLPLEFFGAVLAALKDQKRDWRQTLCLRFYLLCQSPLSRVMAGRWDQLGHGWYRFNTHPPEPPFQRYEWRYSERQRRGEWLEPQHTGVLDDARRQAEAEGLASPFWFPSDAGFKHQLGHIRSVDVVWANALADAQARTSIACNDLNLTPRRFRVALWNRREIAWWADLNRDGLNFIEGHDVA